MNKNKIITSSILGISALSLMLFPVGRVNALEYIKKSNLICTETTEHKNWRLLSPSERKKYMEPTKCEETFESYGTKQIINTKQGNTKGLNSSYASQATFDLRNVNGTSYLTPIRYQEFVLNGNVIDSSLCWAFATTAAIESNILINGGSAVDLSERHIGFSANGLLSDGTTNPYGSIYHTTNAYGEDDGGNNYLSNLYLANQRGPVLESKLPLTTISSTYNNTVGLKQDYRVKNTIMYGGDSCQSGNTINNIKQLIVAYGAVSTSMYAGSDDLTEDQLGSLYKVEDGGVVNWYYNGDTFGNSKPYGGNHAIAIVGWDDNYSKDNFTTTPPGDGAWIIRNTYDMFKTGSNASDVGYHYMSYYDYKVCHNVRAVNSVDQNVPDYSYISAKKGFAEGYVAGPSNTVYYENVFDKASTNSEELHSVTLYGNPGDNFEVYYSETENFANATKIAQGVFTASGYKTVDVTNQIKINTNKFYIYTKYVSTYDYEDGGSTYYAFPVYTNTDLEGTAFYEEMPSVNNDPLTHKYSFNANGSYMSTLSVEGLPFYQIVNVFTSKINYLVNADEPEQTTETMDTNGGTVFVKVTVNNLSLDDVNVSIKNSSNVDSTNKFTITKKSNGFDISVIPDETPAGVYTVTFTYQDVSSSRQFEVVQGANGEVTPVLVTGITVTGADDEVSVNGTLQLGVTVTPSNAANKAVTWSSSDTTKATVDETGKVTGLKAGEVVITATAKDGSNVKGQKTITVRDLNQEEGGDPTTPSNPDEPTNPTTPTTDNPKTGVSTPLIASIVVVISAIVAYIVNKERDFLKHFN